MDTIDKLLDLADKYASQWESSYEYPTNSREALREALTELASTATEYQQAADKMAWDHKEVRDRWIPIFDAIQLENYTLRQQLAEAQALIEASRKQEPVAGMYGGTKVSIGAPYPSDIRHGWTPLFTAPVVADDVLKDANRYRHIVESLPPGTYADCTVYDKESWDSAIDSEITGGQQ